MSVEVITASEDKDTRSAAGTAAESTRMSIRRTSPEDAGTRQLYASLDGRRVAVLGYGDEVTVPIRPGRHELRVHNTLARKTIAFDAAPGQHVRFRAANVPGKGYAALAFLLGVPLMWTVLEREG